MSLKFVTGIFSLLVLFSSTSATNRVLLHESAPGEAAPLNPTTAPAAGAGPAGAGVAGGDLDITNAKYDGKPDCDIAQALLTAFKDACACTTPSKIIVPKGNFKVKEAIFEGPCKSPIELQVQGVLLAPEDDSQLTKKDTWIQFMYINDFTLSGEGTFDGQAAKSWKESGGDSRGKYCGAVNIRFHAMNNTVVKGITSLNSKNFHFNVITCEKFTFENVKIIAPENSPNTDGIHVARSNCVNITDTKIATGDDCISVGDGIKQLAITRVTCGPGHGISIGSLGKFENEAPIEGITIKNCTLINTDNGARIKTWAKNPGPSTVTDVHYEDIIMENVTNPILIDQEYCPSGQCEKGPCSQVKISNVSFKNIKGTTPTPLAVKILCSKDNPCDKVDMADIDLKFTGQGALTSQCTNTKPTITNVPPPLCCASDVAPVAPK